MSILLLQEREYLKEEGSIIIRYYYSVGSSKRVHIFLNIPLECIPSYTACGHGGSQPLPPSKSWSWNELLLANSQSIKKIIYWDEKSLERWEGRGEHVSDPFL